MDKQVPLEFTICSLVSVTNTVLSEYNTSVISQPPPFPSLILTLLPAALSLIHLSNPSVKENIEGTGTLHIPNSTPSLPKNIPHSTTQHHTCPTTLI